MANTAKGTPEAEVVWRIQEIAKKRGINNISQLAAAAHVAYDTAADLWHGKALRLDRRTLARMCVTLQSTPGDLLQLVLSEQREEFAGG